MRRARQPALSFDDNERMAPLFLWASRRPVAVAALLALVGTAAPTRAATLTDGADRRVTIPDGVTRVVPAGPPAQILLHALAPGLLGGLVEPFAPEHVIYVAPEVAALPQIPMLSRTTAPGDIAAVAALKPGLAIDYGRVSARFVAATEKVQEELHVPAVILSGDLADTPSILTTMGGALGQDARGKELAHVVADALGEVKPVSELPDGERVAVYMARGGDGLQAIRAGTALDEPVRFAGGRNVVEGGGGAFRQLAVADVVALKPSVVIFGDIGALSSPLHDALPKTTTFVLDAGEPYKVLVGAPSVNRVVGMLALAALLHPEKVKADPDSIRRLETTLFPIPAGLAVPSPLQVRK